jgi:uncharacterized membrane protein (DUF2068 family)
MLIGMAKAAKRSSDVWIILIGLFKLVKAASLLIVGVGLLRLMHRDVAATVAHWVEYFRLDPDDRYIHSVLSRVLRVTPRQLRELSAGTLIYGTLFLTEGVGLLMRKHWAEYLTVVSTALFIPLEIYEAFERFTLVKLAVLAINAGIVWYLVARLKRER